MAVTSLSSRGFCLQIECPVLTVSFDQIRREFQISQEIARRETLRLQIVEQNYRFAASTMTTPQFLDQVSALDEQKAATFRAWAKLRSQLTRIKLLVLGSE